MKKSSLIVLAFFLSILASFSQKGQPDLIASGLDCQPDIIAGKNLNIYPFVRNVGSATAGGSTLKYYFSTKNYLDATAVYIGSDYVKSLAPMQEDRTESLSYKVPESYSGRYYVLVSVDANNNVSESNENNNVRAEQFFVKSSDLIVMDRFQTPSQISVDESVLTRNIVKNSGETICGRSIFKVFVSRKSYFDASAVLLIAIDLVS